MQGAEIRVERILCPIDYSPSSEGTLRHAIAFAHIFGAELTVLHVVPLALGAYATAMLPHLTLPPPLDPEALRSATDDLRRFSQPAFERGVPTRIAVRQGDPWREIKAAALEIPADLIVMGTHGLSGMRRLLLGSVADKTLRFAHCPVFTVCHEEGRTWEAPELIESVVCAVDLSETSRSPLAFALQLAERKRARLTLLHVVEQGPGENDPVAVAFERLGASVPKRASASSRVQCRVAAGVAHEEILRVAVAERADLIVMGTRAHGPFGRAVLGSTCDQVVRAASCPVLTVPPARRRSRDVEWDEAPLRCSSAGR